MELCFKAGAYIINITLIEKKNALLISFIDKPLIILINAVTV